MVDNRSAPYALLLLRVILGILFFIHAGTKLFVIGPDNVAGFFASLGYPSWLAYVTIAWEIVGGIALVLGVWPRLAAIAMVPVLIGAIISVHGPAGFLFTNPHGGWEYPGLWVIGLLVIALAGDGACVLTRSPISSK
jgi:putative oxidoreductase